jgi:hypothetical protein
LSLLKIKPLIISQRVFLSKIPVNEIVRIILKDTRLVSKWATLARRLNLKETEIKKTSQDGQELLTSLLTDWISLKGFAATLKALSLR